MSGPFFQITTDCNPLPYFVTISATEQPSLQRLLLRSFRPVPPCSADFLNGVRPMGAPPEPHPVPSRALGCDEGNYNCLRCTTVALNDKRNASDRLEVGLR